MGEPVFLIGDASEVGTAQGQHQRDALQERIARLLSRARASDQETVLRERAARFSEVLQQAAPHWLDEAHALSHQAGVEAWHLLALNCLPNKFWGDEYVPAPLADAQAEEQNRELVSAFEAQGYEPLMGGDCTTFFALGPATVGGETLFHKNRDERDELQCLYIKGIEGRNRFIGASDVGNLGTAHLHTEDYWVGGNNTGSPLAPAEYQDCALNDCHVLRYLGETCASLDEIVPAMQHLIEQSWLGGGGPNFGMILLFADAERGLIVEATSRRMAFEWFHDDAMAVRTNHFLLPAMQPFGLAPSQNSLQRFERAQELWSEQHGYAGIANCGEIGRDRQNAPHAICRNPSDGLGSVTVSTSTATISQHDDRRCQTHFRNCHPSYTPAVILTPLDRVSDSDLLSGAHCQAWRNYRGTA